MRLRRRTRTRGFWIASFSHFLFPLSSAGVVRGAGFQDSCGGRTEVSEVKVQGRTKEGDGEKQENEREDGGEVW